jgi:hypothetical protein
MNTPKAHEDRDNLKRTGAELPKSDVVAESGYAAELKAPAAPDRNQPTRPKK